MVETTRRSASQPRTAGGARCTRVLTTALVLALAAAGSLGAGEGGPQPASGPSLLGRVGSNVDRSSLGKAGYIGISPDATEAPAVEVGPGGFLVGGFQLTGADLYRINCRACHGAAAKGLGTVTPSILAKIRAEISDPSKQRAATSAEVALRHRLGEGGAVMPPFAHLSTREIDTLVGYLETIASPTGAGAPALPRIAVPGLVVGEHVVKGVCQTCHDATPGLARVGEVPVQPPLSDITDHYALGQLVRALRSPSAPPDVALHRPRLGYLTADEIAAAYAYLIAYPPVASH